MPIFHQIGSIIECEISKLLPDGTGYGHYNNETFIVYNALPDERVKAKLIAVTKKTWVGIAIEILRPSSERQIPIEDHYLTCSPWQILTFERENFYKYELAKDTFAEKSLPNIITSPIIAPQNRWEYRNKMEFSFTTTEQGISLAFHERGSDNKRAIGSCKLAMPSISRAGQHIEAWLRQHNISESQVKSLLLRSNHQGQVIAGLFVMDENFAIPHDIEELQNTIQGLMICYSDPRSPASVATKILYQQGNLTLQDCLQYRCLHYGLNSFFQIHLDIFSLALSAMQPYIQDADVLDYYSGVGTISLCLSDNIRSCLLLETSDEAIEYAKLNLEYNQIHNFQVIHGRAEKFLDYLHHDKILIIDPPRIGLSPKVMRRICKILPYRIIYLSCNIITQAYDLQQLSPYYQPIYHQLYNFFPASPHSECLVILERR